VSTATSVERFWAEHQVGGPYETLEESEQALAARRALYPALELLMPTDFPGKKVLDYGCGPGHDTVQFLQNGAKLVYYADASPLALATTGRRLALHGYDEDRAVPLLVRDGEQPKLPTADHVHCAGVLHHVTHPEKVLLALRRAINSDGDMRLMVYSGDTSPHTQSAVPITHWWTFDEVFGLAEDAGLDGMYVGSYPCSAPWRPDCDADCYWLKPA
jgi:ubiquinone/menaquinone biosynthesis C-methylase UbiE